MTTPKQQIGQRIKQARENARLTQARLAELASLERSAVAKIETGLRGINGSELERLAKALARRPSELVSPAPLEDDPLALFRSAMMEDASQDALNDCIDLLREIRSLEKALGLDEGGNMPEGYAFPRMAKVGDAVRQGWQAALMERARLGLGDAPIADIADVISRQGIRAASLPMREEVSGIFIRHQALGAAVIVNERMRASRQRFSYAHEYAHALLDRNEPAEVSTRENSHALREARANAFAAEFLLPRHAVTALLDSLKKGESARFRGAVVSSVDDEPQEFLDRTDTSATRVTAREITILSHVYRVSLDVAIYRLLDAGIVRQADKERLLNEKPAASGLLKALRFSDGDPLDGESIQQPKLKELAALLAIEALRREKIHLSRFRATATRAGYSAEDLLDALGVVTEGD